MVGQTSNVGLVEQSRSSPSPSTFRSLMHRPCCTSALVVLLLLLVRSIGIGAVGQAALASSSSSHSGSSDLVASLYACRVWRHAHEYTSVRSGAKELVVQRAQLCILAK